MIANKYFLTFATIYFLDRAIDLSSGLKCYDCSSARDPRCGHPFDPSTIELTDCNMIKPNATVCRKQTQRVKFGDKSDYRVVRSCGYAESKSEYDEAEEELDEEAMKFSRYEKLNECTKRTGTYEVIVTYCNCDTDECNGSNQKVFQLSTLLMSLAVLSQC